MTASAGVPFAKMQGCGNDYVLVDGFRHPVADPPAIARAISDRRFGVGSDGLILVLPSQVADVRMRMFNLDGSESEMCGNGLRLVVRLAWERGLVPHAADARGTAETGAGILGWEVHLDADGAASEVTIDMGRARLDRREIPMVGPPGPVRDEALAVGDRTLAVTAVSMGNPHAVTFVDDVDAFALERYGPLVERHEAFPRRANAEFVEVLSRSEVRQRTWERGCGETFACGTGACAVVVAGVETGRTDREVHVHLRGGDLRVCYEPDGRVRMRGPAVHVFDGVYAPR